MNCRPYVAPFCLFSFAYGIIYHFSTDYPLGIFKIVICLMEFIFGAGCTVMCLGTL